MRKILHNSISYLIGLAALLVLGGTLQAANAQQLRYIQQVDSMADLPVQIAAALGYFKDEGLDVVIGPHAREVSTAVMTGQVQIGAAPFAQVLTAINARRDLVGIGVTLPSTPTYLVLHKNVVSKLAARGVTPKSPLPDRLKALRDLTIAGPAAGSSGDLSLRTMLLGVGLNPDRDVKLVPSDAAAYIPTLRENRTDGFMTTPPTPNQAVANGFALEWIGFHESPELKGIYGTMFIATSKYIKEDPKSVEAFLRAVQRGFKALASDDKTARSAVHEKFWPKLEVKVFEEAWRSLMPVFAPGMFPNEKDLNITAKAVVVQTGQTQLGQFGLSQVFDLKPLERATKGSK